MLELRDLFVLVLHGSFGLSQVLADGGLELRELLGFVSHLLLYGVLGLLHARDVIL